MDIGRYLNKTQSIFDSLQKADLIALADLLEKAYQADQFIFVIGNGGSAANASHFAQDLAKGVNKNDPKRMRALSLTDNIAHITALANDDGYETIFEAQLKAFARKGSVLIAISGSGNSPNIIKAAEYALANDIYLVGITGFDGGQLGSLCQLHIHVPINEMCTAESIHSVLLHWVVLELNERITGIAFDDTCLTPTHSLNSAT